MNWFWWALSAIISLSVGYLYGVSVGGRANNFILARDQHDLACDRHFLFKVLRRELAQWMFRTDPDRYLRTYRQAHQTATDIKAAARAQQLEQHTELCNKFPCYQDFDLIGFRDIAPPDDVLKYRTYEDVEGRFMDIVRFHALQIALKDEWKYFDATTASDLAYLEKSVEEYKDRKFKHRLQEALREYQNFLSTKTEPFRFGDDYDNPEFSVQRVEYIGVEKSRLGFHFKDSDEFGLYSVRQEWFYRCNSAFENEKPLWF